MSVEEGGGSTWLPYYCQLHSRMELLSINMDEEELVRVESSERIARERYSREGTRV